MQATFPIRRLSIQPFLIALAIAAALICSAAAGYWLRSLTTQAAAVTVTRAVVQTSVPPVRSDSVRDLDMAGAAAGSGRASDAIPASGGASGHHGRVLY